jgi:hypothetical protein
VGADEDEQAAQVEGVGGLVGGLIPSGSRPRPSAITSPSARVGPCSHADLLPWEDSGVILQEPLLAAACRVPPCIPYGSVQHSECCSCHQGCGATEPTHPRWRTEGRYPRNGARRPRCGASVAFVLSVLRPLWVNGVGEALPTDVPISIGSDKRSAGHVFGDLQTQFLDCLRLLVQSFHALLPRGERANGIPGRRGAHHPERPGALGGGRRDEGEQAEQSEWKPQVAPPGTSLPASAGERRALPALTALACLDASTH